MDVIEAAKEYITGLFGSDHGGHDAAHTLRVYRSALMIADREGNCDREIVCLAALLHDADDHKLFRTENNANARAFLSSHGVDEKRTERIIAAVNGVSFSQNRGRRPDTPEGMIVQDADRLDAIGAVGIARTFAYGGEHGRPMSSSLAHFHEKLLLLKDEMNTPTARALAQERHDFMVSFLARYADETGEEA